MCSVGANIACPSWTDISRHLSAVTKQLYRHVSQDLSAQESYSLFSTLRILLVVTEKPTRNGVCGKNSMASIMEQSTGRRWLWAWQESGLQ